MLDNFRVLGYNESKVVNFRLIMSGHIVHKNRLGLG